MSRYAALAKLRPMMSMQAIADATGDGWRVDDLFQSGFYVPPGREAVLLRVDDRGQVMAISFGEEFPSDLAIDGLHIGMARNAVTALLPALVPDADTELDDKGAPSYRCAAEAGHDIALKFENDKLICVTLTWPNAVYWQPTLKIYPTPLGIRAYDLEILPHGADRTAADNNGWVFGLPPGITTGQWPLDPISGYPLMHGFTLKLPEDYRVHEPEIVALSFFATAADQNDGGARPRHQLYATIMGSKPASLSNDTLRPFWEQAQSRHPRLHRMNDVLDYEYAVILLTQAEFDGPFCQPPAFGANLYLKVDERPQWMTTGSGYAAAFFEGCNTDRPSASHNVVPEQRLDWNRAIGCTPRAADLNAGLAPEEVYGGQVGRSGYTCFWYSEGEEIDSEGQVVVTGTYRDYEWAEDHKLNHIGGTMRPSQAPPAFSPFYIGFEEGFGGYNFGGGNAQLDFLEMEFDWACG